MSYLGTPHLIKFLLAFKQGIRGENNTFEVKTRGFLFPVSIMTVAISVPVIPSSVVLALLDDTLTTFGTSKADSKNKWASGGNLSSFWMKESPRGQLDMLKWHLYQLRGLADAIMKLHALHTRHGDIKPVRYWGLLLF